VNWAEGVLGLRGLVVKLGPEEVDGLDKSAGPDLHHEVDGVEVPSASEASGQVGLRIGGGVEVRAQGTQEAESSLDGLRGPFEDFSDEAVDGDLVAELKKERF